MRGPAHGYESGMRRPAGNSAPPCLVAWRPDSGGDRVCGLSATRVKRGSTRRRERGMTWGSGAVLASAFALATLAAQAPAAADVFSVPDSIRQMRGTHEDVHVLRALSDGSPLGEQRFRATVKNDRLMLEVTTHF